MRLVLATALAMAIGAAGGVSASAADDGGILDPQAARAAVETAREYAAADRHTEAADWYLRALAHDARLVPQVAEELAHQKLWREDAERALFYFRRYLAATGGQADRRVRLGLALANSWSGRQAAAAEIYRALIAEDPAAGDALAGLGRTLIWDNRLREGLEVLLETESRFPPPAAPGREAGDFLLTALDGYTLPAHLRAAASWDSDDLEIRRLSAHTAWTVGGNRLLEVRPERVWYTQPGEPDVRGWRLGGGLVTALAHDWALHAYGWLDVLRSDGAFPATGGELDWNRPGGDVWLTWLPAPRLRLDAGASSTPLETLPALRDRIGVRRANLSADWRLRRRWTLGAGLGAGDYDDGNSDRRVQAHLTWKREGLWELEAGPRLTILDFDLAYPGGYWAPDRVRNLGLAARVSRRWPRFIARVEGSVGQEKETGSDAVTVGGGNLHLGWRCHPAWLLALDAGHAQSRFSSAGGYRRTTLALALRGFF